MVDLRRLPSSVDDYSVEGIKLGSPASLNDCMMRNVYSRRFIVVVDFDEIIVPQKCSNYSAMIAHIDRSLGLSISYHTYTHFATPTFLCFTRKMRPSRRIYARCDCVDAAHRTDTWSERNHSLIPVVVCLFSTTTAGFRSEVGKKVCRRWEGASMSMLKLG